METGLKDRVVIIAGASQGIGRAAAEAFTQERARLAIFSRNRERIHAAAEEIRSTYKTEVHGKALDATDTEGVQKFIHEVAERFGRIDVCIPNAGGPPAKNFLSTTVEDWRKAVETNFLSAVVICKAAIPYMQRNHWGRVITITSTSSKHPVPDLVLSNAVRPAVMALIKSLSVEFGADNISFNNVGPGYTTTERLVSLAATRALAAGVSPEKIYKELAAEVPMKRLATPQEVADTILWLASERASYVTGQSILVDGGIYHGF